MNRVKDLLAIAGLTIYLLLMLAGMYAVIVMLGAKADSL